MSDFGTSRSAAANANLAALRCLLDRVLQGNAFYQQKLAGLEPSRLASVNDFSENVPFSNKPEFVADQADYPPYGRNLTQPIGRYNRLHQTSGTTGSPLRWLDTPESWEVVVQDWVEVFRQAGVHAEDRLFFAFSFGPFLGFWGAFEAAQRLGCLVIAGGGMSTALRARVILENGCTVLCCTPTYALHLAEQARLQGLDLATSAIRRIVVAGEPGGSVPATRDRLQSAWNGARVFDHHGMTEVGPVTYEDPTAPGTLVLLDRSHFAEVIDPATLRPTPVGQTGELVLTTLRRIDSPAIRYRTGDLVRAPDNSPGGPPKFIGGILGRVDDMVVVRGVNVYPTGIDQWVRSIPELGEYRVTVDARQPMVELRIEVEGSPEAAIELERRLRAQLGLRIPVEPVAPGVLPHFEMKARRWHRLGAQANV